MAGRKTTREAAEALELAVDAAAADGELGDPARALLLQQARLTNAQERLTWWQIQSERGAFAFKILTVLVGVIVAVVASVFVWSAASSRAVVVESFDTPPALVERGLTPQVVAGQIQDALASIQADNIQAAKDRNVNNAWTSDIKVQVPSLGISIGDLDRILRAKLGHETHIGGAVVRNLDGTISLVVRATGVPPRTFTGRSETLPKLITEAADYVYGQFEPALYGRHVLRHRTPKEALAFIDEAYPHAADDQRAALSRGAGTAYSLMGDYPKAVAKFREAIELDPYDWSAWTNLLSNLPDVEGEESAFAAGRMLEQRIAEAPSEKLVSGVSTPQAFYWALKQDWTDFYDGYERARLAMPGRRVDLGLETVGFLAEAESRRHNHKAALRMMSAMTPGPMTDAVVALLIGRERIEAGDLPGALPPFESLNRIERSDQEVEYNFTSEPCAAALAFGLAGRNDDANAIFAKRWRYAECRTFAAM